MWETLQAEDEINYRVIGMGNDYYSHVMPLLLFRKRCLMPMLYYTHGLCSVIMVTHLFTIQNHTVVQHYATVVWLSVKMALWRVIVGSLCFKNKAFVSMVSHSPTALLSFSFS